MLYFEGEGWRSVKCHSCVRSCTCFTPCAQAAGVLQVDRDEMLQVSVHWPVHAVKQNVLFVLVHINIPLWMAPCRRTVLYVDSRNENKMHQLGSVVLTQQRGDTSYRVHWPELSAVIILICPLSFLIILTVLSSLVSSLTSQELCTI